MSFQINGLVLLVSTDPRLRITLGVHSHMITESQVTSLFGRLVGLLDQYPEAVGVGEVGLDLTMACRHNCRNGADAVVRNLRDSADSCSLSSSLRSNLTKFLFFMRAIGILVRRLQKSLIYFAVWI